MLKQSCPKPKRQEGIVLVIALIMLVAMTLGGLAMMRSVTTSAAIAGNLAFQQSTTNSADIGMEAAIIWLENNTDTGILENNSLANGYTAFKTVADDPAAEGDWPTVWTNVFVPRGVVTNPTDAIGNTTQYAIQRLCATVGPSDQAICAASPAIKDKAPGSSKGAGSVVLIPPPKPFYRITVRVTGPRNTVSFTQTTISL
jgi:Tfp pilus assembly protein PilX